MVDYTDEQLADILRQKNEAVQYEQWRSAFLRDYRIVMQYLASITDQVDDKGRIVKQGLVTQFEFTVFAQEMRKILIDYELIPKEPEKQNPAPE